MKVQEVKYISDYIISIKFDDGVYGTAHLFLCLILVFIVIIVSLAI